MSSAGPRRATWRHSSEPIDPPAPVTATTRPVRYVLAAAMSVATRVRPSRSISFGSRMSTTADVSAEELLDRRQDLHVQPGVLRARHEISDQDRIGTGHRDEQGGRAVSVRSSGEIGAGPDHPDALDREAELLRVVVEERDGHIRGVGIAQQGVHGLLPAGARAEDEEVSTAVGAGPSSLLREPSPEPPGGAHQDERQQSPDDRGRQREGSGRDLERVHGEEDHAGRADRVRKRGQLVEAPRHPASDVEPEERADGPLSDHRDRRRLRQGGRIE